jgi:transposase
LQRVGLALGGEAGARLLRAPALETSPDTLLRLVRQMSLMPVPTPRVLGVDDWAWRRGQRYGTLLCDLEQHRVVDLLPDRRAETFAAWLTEHPGVEIISRDRAGNYAEGGRVGAPEALQVADRWHLIQNLATALDLVVRRQIRSLKRSKKTEGKQEQAKKPSTPQLRLTPAQRQRRELLQEQFHLVQRLYEEGRSVREIAGIVGIDANALRYFVRSQPWAAAQPHRGRKAAEAGLDAYLPYLHKRWKAGCQNGLQLWRELHARGYPGSVSSVKPYVTLLRQIPEDLLPPAFAKPEQSTPEEAFSVRRIIWLTLSRPEELAAEQRQVLGQVCSLSASVATTLRQAQTFVKLLRQKQVDALDGWLESAKASSIRELRQFAKGALNGTARRWKRPSPDQKAMGKPRGM